MNASIDMKASETSSSSIALIDHVETLIVDLPLRRTQQFSAIGATMQSIVLVRIRTSDGLVGVGEAVTPSGPWWGGESVETIKAIIDTRLSALLLSKSVFDSRAIMQAMDAQVFGNSFAKAGVEMALWDAMGKALGQPVYNLLGGKVRDHLYLSWPLATGDPKAEIAEVEDKLDKRLHRIFKFKMGAVSPEADVARAIEVMDAIGDRASFRADPNGRWDETTAKWAIPRLVDAGLDLIEQPLPREPMEGGARVTAATSIPHLLDESVCTLADMLRVANMRAGDCVSIKPMKHGGLGKARTIADVALAAGIPLFMGTFLETSFGTGAAMQLCATFSELPYDGELFGPMLMSEDVCTVPADFRDFALHLQPGDGLGVELDLDRVRHLQRDRDYSLHALGG